MSYQILSTAVGGLVAAYVLFQAFLRLTQNSGEPPVVHFPIPFLGPVIGMIMRKSKFYSYLRDVYGYPIHTLRLPGSCIYVINSTSLIPVAQRQFKTLAFGPIEVKAAENVMGASRAAVKIMSDEMVADHGYLTTFKHSIHPALSPGVELDAMNRVSVESIATSPNAVTTERTRIQLFNWVRHQIFVATSDGVYGPQNPFRHLEVEAAWYEFEPTIVLFLINLAPKFLAAEAYCSRELVVKALTQYFRENGHLKASGLTKRRYEHNIQYKIPIDDIPRTEVGNIFAIIGSTGPAAFWMIYHIYSDPNLLDDCRREVSSIIQSNTNVRKLDITNVKTQCPTLLSILQEVLRFHGTGISTRVVLEDHHLDGKYLLKKGNMLMIPAPVQHSFWDIWGENVNEFYARRFVRSSKRQRPNPVAFRGFGGGTVLCPGRHFASTELLAFTALMIMRFDIQPLSGEWKYPGTQKASPSASVAPPDVEIDVELVTRDHFDWEISFSGSDQAMEIAAEDINTV
ncbi:cytochrome P450 oxidoreductase [Nemania sp. FL0916]|nr:cytochrome P450 oxidoreductase [Nemania sp. FL0916]